MQTVPFIMVWEISIQYRLQFQESEELGLSLSFPLLVCLWLFKRWVQANTMKEAKCLLHLRQQAHGREEPRV